MHVHNNALASMPRIYPDKDNRMSRRPETAITIQRAFVSTGQSVSALSAVSQPILETLTEHDAQLSVDEFFHERLFRT